MNALKLLFAAIVCSSIVAAPLFAKDNSGEVKFLTFNELKTIFHHARNATSKDFAGSHVFLGQSIIDGSEPTGSIVRIAQFEADNGNQGDTHVKWASNTSLNKSIIHRLFQRDGQHHMICAHGKCSAGVVRDDETQPVIFRITKNHCIITHDQLEGDTYEYFCKDITPSRELVDEVFEEFANDGEEYEYSPRIRSLRGGETPIEWGLRKLGH